MLNVNGLPVIACNSDGPYVHYIYSAVDIVVVCYAKSTLMQRDKKSSVANSAKRTRHTIRWTLRAQWAVVAPELRPPLFKEWIGRPPGCRIWKLAWMVVTALRRKASRLNVSSTGFRGCEEAATNSRVSPNVCRRLHWYAWIYNWFTCSNYANVSLKK